ncbi:hypothetical protein L195_g057539, partial [Trifolium pratense]
SSHLLPFSKFKFEVRRFEALNFEFLANQSANFDECFWKNEEHGDERDEDDEQFDEFLEFMPFVSGRRVLFPLPVYCSKKLG